MMQNQEIEAKISDLLIKINKRLQHPYLMRYIEKPIIDEDKLLLTYIILNEKGLSEEELDNYAMSTMLVQVALDTHERITSQDLSSDEGRKNRQLTVLAGDYYSSLYYFLLSELKDLSMIRALAQAIQEINENKMQFYMNDNQSIENSMENLHRIESTLLLKTADYFHLPLWKGIADEFFFMKRMLHERSHVINNTYTPLTAKIMHHLNRSKGNWLSLKNQILDIIDSYILHSKGRLEKLWSQEPVMHTVLERRLEQYIKHSGFRMKKYAEEG
ncbi:heptaprenyl diphosphate synthase component 1 [Pseudalkalibacillus berkeleyi]|uniref:Heptaprenyl diphosphate synthase component 1 n=1 Tax=Pseudalkalibacillus berkeleyi TaxID=1069813 RepID=A0ABS9H111_9BACL|nr:heptaprenyl diphosphate synthase component 1 [Pseudalkalibacillus berkeleyi]MCF6137579.1 heptaprenyl diphosphate synthase component 1 [Pseudalkalibacillus berkeleyi]